LPGFVLCAGARAWHFFLMNEEAPSTFETRAGMVAVVGRTNVGKSTLLNRLLGEKVSIVSYTVQTTRNLIRAILTEPRGQLVFLDTPGVHKANGAMGSNMNKIARRSVDGVDVVLLVVDASRPPQQEDEGWLRRLLFAESETIVWLNKSDLGRSCAEAYRRRYAEICSEKEQHKPLGWLEGSALDGRGTAELLEALMERVPTGPLLFPEEVLTDYPRKLNIGDVIREKLFVRLHSELPHSVAVWVEQIDEQDGRWAVEAFIYVERHSQKGIVIGEKGRLLKRVRQEAEQELEAMYGFPVKLKLWVKVEKKWRQNFWMLKKLGYA
jgi:GTP-binding protein Era